MVFKHADNSRRCRITQPTHKYVAHPSLVHLFARTTITLSNVAFCYVFTIVKPARGCCGKVWGSPLTSTITLRHTANVRTTFKTARLRAVTRFYRAVNCALRVSGAIGPSSYTATLNSPTILKDLCLAGKNNR
jgi:hypothetical protein